MNSQLAKVAVDAVATSTTDAGLAFSWRSVANAALVLIAVASAGLNRLPNRSGVPTNTSQLLLHTSGIATAKAHLDANENIEIRGTVFALDSQPILAKSSGRVEQLHVSDGDQVESGAPLIRLQNASLEKNLENARRSVAAAKRNLERLTLRVDLERAESQVELLKSRNDYEESLRIHESDSEMFKRGFISRQRLRFSRERLARQRLSFETRVQREATTDRSNALHIEENEIKLAQAERQLTDAETKVAALAIHSTTTGKVDFQPGKTISPGCQVSEWTTVARIYQPNSLRIQFRISEHKALRVGTVIDIEIFGQHRRTQIEAISQIDGTTVAVAAIPNFEAGADLQPAQVVTARVTSEQEQTLSTTLISDRRQSR